MYKFNPQSFSNDILKEIVVGNPSAGATANLAPGTTLLKPTILQNKKQEQIKNKNVIKNTKMLVTTATQQHQHQQQHPQHHKLQQKLNNHTVITTTTTDNSSQMFAALGMELVKAPTVAQTVQKLPQVSLLQNSSKKSTNDSTVKTILKNPHEIKVGIAETVMGKRKASEDFDRPCKIITKSNNHHHQSEVMAKKETNKSYSLLKTSLDLKKNISEIDNNTTKPFNTPVEKQKSLSSPRSQRSNSCNTVLKQQTSQAAATNSERRHSEPAKIEVITSNNTEVMQNNKEQINESLLCDEQFLISSSSSVSNNSVDHNTAMTSLIKSPQSTITTTTTTSPLLKKTKAFTPKNEPQSNGYSSVLDILSTFNMLNWRERIGTARGTNLKFQPNEFNLIQVYEKSMPNKSIHTAYEKPIYERESSHRRNENGDSPTYICRRCNVQGPPVDFLAPEFCSLSCLKRDCPKRRDDLPQVKKDETKLSKTSNTTSTSPVQAQNSDDNVLDVKIDIAKEYLLDYGPRLQQNFTLWQKNFTFDAEKITSNPHKWSATEVSDFVDFYLKCRKTATIFIDEDINGEAFLLMQQDDLTKILGLKLGPAVKLYSCILQLCTLAVTKFGVPYKLVVAKN